MSKKRMDILDSISMPFKICGQKTLKIFIHLNLIYRYICIYKVSANLFKMLKCDSFIEIIRGLEWDQWLCYFAAHVQISCNSSALVGSLTMWGTFVLATSSMAASAIDLATSVSMAPLWDSSSSTTLDVNRTLKVDSTRWFPNTARGKKLSSYILRMVFAANQLASIKCPKNPHGFILTVFVIKRYL